MLWIPDPTLSVIQLKAFADRVPMKSLRRSTESSEVIWKSRLLKTTRPSSGSSLTPSPFASVVTGTGLPSISVQILTEALASELGDTISVQSAHSPVTLIMRSVGLELRSVACKRTIGPLETGPIGLAVADITSMTEADTPILSAGKWFACAGRTAKPTGASAMSGRRTAART